MVQHFVLQQNMVYAASNPANILSKILIEILSLTHKIKYSSLVSDFQYFARSRLFYKMHVPSNDIWCGSL